MNAPPVRGRIGASTPVGALLGAGVGLVLGKGSLPGALIGALLGHLFQKQLAGGPRRGSVTEQAVARAATLVQLAVAMARIDGPIVTAEREAIRSYFQRDAGLPSSYRSTVDRLIDTALEAGADDPAELIRSMPPLDPSDQVHVLFVLFRIALADRSLLPPEEQTLRQVALGLGLSDQDYHGIRAHFVADGRADGSGGEDDFDLLGLARTSDPEAIKSAYRTAVKNYHPDRFKHLGEEFTSVAEEKFKRVHEAYERITSGTSKTPIREPLSVCAGCRLFSASRLRDCPRCSTPKYEEQDDQLRCRCPFCTQVNGFPRSAIEGQVRCGNCKVLLVR